MTPAKPYPLDSSVTPLKSSHPADIQYPMDSQDLEAFAQFLQMNGMAGPSGGPKKVPSFWETFEGKATVSTGMFIGAIFLFRQFGDSLA